MHYRAELKACRDPAVLRSATNVEGEKGRGWVRVFFLCVLSFLILCENGMCYVNHWFLATHVL